MPNRRAAESFDMNTPDRSALFRRRAAESEQKAAEAKAEETRRAWLIIARDWARMAQREEMKTLSELEAKQTPLVPTGGDPS